MSLSPVIVSWANAKQDLLRQIRRNQPAPYSKLIAAVAIKSGLRRTTVVEWVDTLIDAGLVRLDPQNRLQLEETAEALLGYK